MSILLVGLAVSLVLAEIALRVAGISFPSFWTLDTERGWAARPNSSGRYVKEGNAYVRMNHEGFRDVDHQVPKGSGIFRVAVVGDSFVEALQVPLEFTFWKILGQELEGCPSLFDQKGIEVLGFGGSGYGTAQEYITYRSHVAKYNPDIVILAFYIANDVTDNYRPLDYSSDRPYFVLDDGTLVLDEAFRQNIRLSPTNIRWAHLTSLVDRLRLLQILKVARHSIRARFQGYGSGDIEPGIASEVFREPRNEAWTEAWRVTEAMLEEFRKTVRSDGAEFWLLTIPSAIQVHPDLRLREEFKERLGIDSLGYPESRLGEWAEAQSVPMISLSAPLKERSEIEREIVHGFGEQMGFGHWNQTGHRFAGEIAATVICDALGATARSDVISATN